MNNYYELLKRHVKYTHTHEHTTETEEILCTFYVEWTISRSGKYASALGWSHLIFGFLESL